MYPNVYICRARSRPARHSARLFPFLYINVDINPSIFFSPARLIRRYFHAYSFSLLFFIFFCFIFMIFGCKIAAVRNDGGYSMICMRLSLILIIAFNIQKTLPQVYTDSKTITHHVPGDRSKFITSSEVYPALAMLFRRIRGACITVAACNNCVDNMMF